MHPRRAQGVDPARGDPILRREIGEGPAGLAELHVRRVQSRTAITSSLGVALRIPAGAGARRGVEDGQLVGAVLRRHEAGEIEPRVLLRGSQVPGTSSPLRSLSPHPAEQRGDDGGDPDVSRQSHALRQISIRSPPIDATGRERPSPQEPGGGARDHRAGEQVLQIVPAHDTAGRSRQILPVRRSATVSSSVARDGGLTPAPPRRSGGRRAISRTSTPTDAPTRTCSDQSHRSPRPNASVSPHSATAPDRKAPRRATAQRVAECGVPRSASTSDVDGGEQQRRAGSRSQTSRALLGCQR